MATALKVAPLVSNGTPPQDASSTEWLTFGVYEENSGLFRWQVATATGDDVATSCESFPSEAAARRAIARVRPRK